MDYTQYQQQANKLKAALYESVLAIQDKLQAGTVLLFSHKPDEFTQQVITRECFETFPYVTDHFYINQWDDEHSDSVFGICQGGILCERGFGDTEVIDPDDLTIEKLLTLLEYAGKYPTPYALEAVAAYLPEELTIEADTE